MINKQVLDMGYGNPSFIQELWNTNPLIDVTYDRSYQHSSGIEDLKSAIKALHYKFDNVEMNGKHLVIGHGATQVIQAAIYALKGQYVTAKAPHFGRFPIFSKLAGKEFSYNNNDIEIISYPNNPDASITSLNTEKGKSIYDLCYCWPHYFSGTTKIDKEISIFSLSKVLGYSSTRIGWAFVSDFNVYSKMKNFIEFQSSDVSIDAQYKAMSVIRHYLFEDKNLLDKAKFILQERWSQVKNENIPHLNEEGMFLWSDNSKYFKSLGAVGILGETFGVTNEYIRLNIGCDSKTFEEFIKRAKNL